MTSALPCLQHPPIMPCCIPSCSELCNLRAAGLLFCQPAPLFHPPAAAPASLLLQGSPSGSAEDYPTIDPQSPTGAEILQAAVRRAPCAESPPACNQAAHTTASLPTHRSVSLVAHSASQAVGLHSGSA